MPEVRKASSVNNLYFPGQNVRLDHTSRFSAFDSGGTGRALLYINASDKVLVGTSALDLSLEAPPEMPAFTVASAPAAGEAGRVMYCTNGDAGSPCLAVDNGTNWLRVALGAAISAT